MFITRTFLNKGIVTKSIKRSIHWISKSNQNIYTIGLQKNKIEKINNIVTSKRNFISKYDILTKIYTNTFDYSIKAPFDCEIINLNKSAYLNSKYNDNEDKLWLLKIKPIDYYWTQALNQILKI